MQQNFGPTSKSHPCWICAKSEIYIRHRHYSTPAGLQKAIENKKTHIFCAVCKELHATSFYLAPKNVLCSSSTLHNAWNFQDYKANVHYEVNTICGGRMRDGRINFVRDYCDQPYPFNLLILLGINDVAHTSLDDFKQEMLTWVQEVEDHQKKFGVKDKVGFICFPRAPQHFWYAGNGPKPPNYVDYSVKVDKMHKAMKLVNVLKANSTGVITFEGEGKRKQRNGKWQHEYRNWRETSPENMLHLKDHYRSKMLRRIEKFFSTKPLPA